MFKKFFILIALLSFATALGCAANPAKPQAPDCPKKSGLIMLDDSDKE